MKNLSLAGILLMFFFWFSKVSPEKSIFVVLSSLVCFSEGFGRESRKRTRARRSAAPARRRSQTAAAVAAVAFVGVCSRLHECVQ
jgi:hypothetical protein